MLERYHKLQPKPDAFRAESRFAAMGRHATGADQQFRHKDFTKRLTACVRANVDTLNTYFDI